MTGLPAPLGLSPIKTIIEQAVRESAADSRVRRGAGGDGIGR
jgi:hypothetical protein